MRDSFIESLRYALAGLGIAWREEINFRIEVFLATVALVLSYLLGFGIWEYVILFLVITIVLTAEMLNTALENLGDKFGADNDPFIAKVKDLAAAAVLIVSIGAGIVGAILFLPPLLQLLP